MEKKTVFLVMDMRSFGNHREMMADAFINVIDRITMEAGMLLHVQLGCA
jgi:hypothetical protein